VALICFFVPWVTLSNTRELIDRLPWEIGVLLRDLVAKYSSFSGWQLSVTLSVANTLFRVAILLAMGAAIVGLINTALSVLSSGWSNQILNYVQCGWATLGVILLAANASNLQRLGHRGNLVWNVVASLLGSRLGIGFWGTIVGLAMTALGGFLTARENA
jgi:hypothetical protein